MAEAIKNNPKAIIANIEKYSPTLYSLSSFELRLISITKVVESNIKTLKNSENGSTAIVPINKLETKLPPMRIENKVKAKPPNNH